MSPFLKSFLQIGASTAIAYAIYYRIKPLIPKILQIYLRRKWVAKKLAACKGCWPIEEMAGACPGGWTGWPEGRRFALVLTHDVETSSGIEKCVDLAKLETKEPFFKSYR